MPAGVILLAAGSGRRLGGRRPKQLLPLNGIPLFIWSLRVFNSSPIVSEIVLVVPPRTEWRYARMVAPYRLRKLRTIVAGGAYRGASVRNGYRAVSQKPDVILVHDAARPLVTVRIIADVARAARRFGASLAAWPLPDTLKQARSNETVRRTIPRAGLWLAQTPQGFHRPVAEACLAHPSKTATDDVELAERRGFRVKLVPARPDNLKVTYPHDTAICRALLNATK